MSLFSPTSSSRSSGLRSLNRGVDEEAPAFGVEADDSPTTRSSRESGAGPLSSYRGGGGERMMFLAASSSTSYGTTSAAPPPLPALSMGTPQQPLKREHRKSKKRKDEEDKVGKGEETSAAATRVVERTLDSEDTQFNTEKDCVVAFCDDCGRVMSKCSCQQSTSVPTTHTS